MAGTFPIFILGRMTAVSHDLGSQCQIIDANEYHVGLNIMCLRIMYASKVTSVSTLLL